MKKSFLFFSIGIAAVCIFVIVVLATGLWKRFIYPVKQEQQRTRIVIPRETDFEKDSGYSGQAFWEESFNTKITMNEGEIVIVVLNQEFEGALAEQQVAAYRKQSEPDGPVYLTFIKYDERTREYRRIWDVHTAAARSDTISLFTQDIIGDRNNCIIVTGMNSRNEHTLTIFRIIPGGEQNAKKIAELNIDGSIIIQETTRSLAYQQGIAKGQSYNIVAYSHDSESANILDQLEITYVFNPITEQYEQSSVTRIPGSRIEQLKLRELLSGTPGVFENFINELWYFVSPQGTLDTRQHVYFDSKNKEIIFYGEENQQVFLWQNSTPTRYGLYITCQNISISTLKRSLFIELESLDSIRLRVVEELRLKINVSATWDGTYRRAGNQSVPEKRQSIKSAENAVYDSTWGKIQFFNTGEYSLSTGSSAADTVVKGRYVFFKVDGKELLELRPEGGAAENRMVYRFDTTGENSMILYRVRLGTSGVQDLLELPVTLTPVTN